MAAGAGKRQPRRRGQRERPGVCDLGVSLGRGSAGPAVPRGLPYCSTEALVRSVRTEDEIHQLGASSYPTNTIFDSRLSIFGTWLAPSGSRATATSVFEPPQVAPVREIALFSRVEATKTQFSSLDFRFSAPGSRFSSLVSRFSTPGWLQVAPIRELLVLSLIHI